MSLFYLIKFLIIIFFFTFNVYAQDADPIGKYQCEIIEDTDFPKNKKIIHLSIFISPEESDKLFYENIYNNWKTEKPEWLMNRIDDLGKNIEEYIDDHIEFRKQKKNIKIKNCSNDYTVGIKDETGMGCAYDGCLPLAHNNTKEVNERIFLIEKIKDTCSDGTYIKYLNSNYLFWFNTDELTPSTQPTLGYECKKIN